MWAYGLVIWEMIALSPPHVEFEESINSSAFDDSTFDDSMNLNENDDPNLSLSDNSMQITEEKSRAKYGELIKNSFNHKIIIIQI